MIRALWIILFHTTVYNGQPVLSSNPNTLYLTFNAKVDPAVVKQVFDRIYETPPITGLNFKTLSPQEMPGIFGTKGYFTSRMKLPKFTCSNNSMDIYVTTEDIDPAKILKASVALLEEMRGASSSSTEHTIIAMPKYKTDIQNPFELLPFINITQKIKTQMSMFWYQNEDEDILTSKINEATVDNVILLLSPENLKKVINAAYEKNLFIWSRRWVIAPLGGGVPEPPNGNEVKNANISVLYVGNDQKPTVPISDTMEAKLAYDTAHAAKAYIEKACKGVVKTQIYNGLTGDFDFQNIHTPRKNIALKVARGLMTTVENVGSVIITGDTYTVSGDYNQTFSFTNEAIEAILKSRIMRIAVVMAPPFAMFADAKKQISTIESCDMKSLTGLTIDVVKEILGSVGVKYECTCYPASMINTALLSINNGLADMAVGEFAVLPQLRDYFDFISNFLYFTFSILEKPEISQERTFLWLFFKPLSAGSWVMIVFCTIIVALVLATLNYFSQNQVDYGFNESIFVAFGCLFQGLTVSPPNKWSSRFMLSVWWLFVLFFIIIYIANYAAIIMYNGIKQDASGFTALLVNPTVPFGALPTSLAAAIMNRSQVLEMQKINYLSDKLYPQNNEASITIEDRVQQVREGKYRLISDSFTLEYFANKYCLTVTGEYSSQQYAIILKLKTVYTKYLDQMLTSLINDGTIKQIIDSYTDQRISNGCETPVKQGANGGGQRYKITLSDVGGIFILMLIGIVIGIILSIIECLFARQLAPIADRILRTETRAKLRNFF